MTTIKACCFTGHRPEKLPWRFNETAPGALALKAKLYEIVTTLYESGVTHFLCGMARGCDFYFCEAVLRLREECQDITIEAVLPFEEQAAKWPEHDRNRYFHLISQCDYETIIQHEYSDDCMRKRNYYMVENASVLIAVYSGIFGGTMQTVSYAQKHNLNVITLSP